MFHPILFLVGYCKISVSADKAADFINLCAAAGISYINSGLSSDGEKRYFVATERATRTMMRLCERYGIDVKAEQRRGIPELLRRFFKRGGLVVGMLLSVAMIFMSGRVIWGISVVGNENISEITVKNILHDCGMRVGSRIDTLDIDNIQTRALIATDKISWISINIVGSVAEVEIREAVQPPPKDDIVCSNLIATHSGTIAYFDKVRGDICVSIGEAISEGQLLVSGVYGSDTQGLRFVRSRGSVFALCEREYDIKVPLQYTKKVYTGEQKTQISLIFFEKEVKFFGKCRNSYASCDTIDNVEYFNFFGLGKLPIAIRTVKYVEYEEKEAYRDEALAAAEAERMLYQSFFSDAPGAQLIKKQIDARLEDDAYRIYAKIECIEDVAREQEVEITLTDISFGGING